MAHRFFEGASHAALYSQFRPTYPRSLVQRIAQYVKEKRPACSHVADVGCGSGQFTQLLAEEFEHVVGVDISEAQITEANRVEVKQNIVYKVGSGECIPAEKESLDLVTVAQAVHWFDLDKFYAELDRVLKPHGCVVLIGYLLPAIHASDTPTSDALRDLVNEFMFMLLSEKYMSDRVLPLHNHYKDIHLPLEDVIRDDSFEMRYEATVTHFSGYLRTWSGYQKYREQNPEKADPIEAIQDRLMKILNIKTKPEETKINVKEEIFCVFGRKPGKSPDV